MTRLFWWIKRITKRILGQSESVFRKPCDHSRDSFHCPGVKTLWIQSPHISATKEVDNKQKTTKFPHSKHSISLFLCRWQLSNLLKVPLFPTAYDWPGNNTQRSCCSGSTLTWIGTWICPPKGVCGTSIIPCSYTPRTRSSWPSETEPFWFTLNVV